MFSRRIGEAVTLRSLFAACALASACGPSFDNPPEQPLHDDVHGGAAHAFSNRYPFLCRAPDDLRELVRCPSNRPSDEQLSCDASGCHGGNAYDGVLERRHLRGSEGPSCYTCHGVEWTDAGRDPKAPIDLEQINRQAHDER